MDLEEKLLPPLDAGKSILLTSLDRFLKHDPLGFDDLAKALGGGCPVHNVHLEGQIGFGEILSQIGQNLER
jgi:hypothetical protein